MAAVKSKLARESYRPQLLTRGFVFLCAATFLGYAHIALLTPILPLFIIERGGTASLVGLIIAAFSVTSFLFRPFIGQAVDHWSARGVMIVGTVVLGICSLGYLVYHALLLFIVRAVHGTGWAAYNTGAKVLVSTSAPEDRRGEAAGYFTMSQTVAIALVPAIALWLLEMLNFGGIFVLSSICGFLAVTAGLAMPRTPQAHAAVRRETFWGSLFERSALLPSALEFLTKFTQPAAAIFISPYAKVLGISIKSHLPYYYLGFGLISIAARGMLGSWSDRIGRGRIIGLGAMMSVAALIIVSQATGIVVLVLSGVLFGLGTASFAPSVLALAIDMAPSKRRGAAIATYSMAFQLAQGVGGLLAGTLIDTVGFQAMYLSMTVAPAIALVLVYKNRGAIRLAKSTSSF